MNKRYYQKPVIEVVQIQSHTLLTQTSLTINRRQPQTVEELEEEGLTPDTDGYLWGFYFFIPYATAYIFICFTMASRPFERVGDRWSRRPMRSMK